MEPNLSKQIENSGSHGDRMHFMDSEQIPFKLLKILGRGDGSVIEKVKDTTNGRVISRKVIFSSFGRIHQYEQIFLDESERLKRLVHPHITRILGTYISPEHVAILQPVADNNLADYLSDITKFGNPATSEQVTLLRGFFGCLASGLAFIHANYVRHRNIKPSNILIHRNTVMYTDFLDPRNSLWADRGTTIGTIDLHALRYDAPEVLDLRPSSRKSDIFSLGCVYTEILGALTPIQQVTDLKSTTYSENLDELRNSLSHSEKAMVDYSKLISVVLHMLEHDPQRRPPGMALVMEIKLLQQSGTNTTTEYFCDACSAQVSKDLKSSMLSKVALDYHAQEQTTAARATDSVMRTAPAESSSDPAESIWDHTVGASSDTSASVAHTRHKDIAIPQRTQIASGETDIHLNDGKIQFPMGILHDDTSSSEGSIYITKRDDDTGITECEDDDESVASDDSESSSFDPGPWKRPSDLPSDEHIVNPTGWIRKLELMEKDIVLNSVTFHSIISEEQALITWEACVNAQNAIRQNIQRMKKVDYFTDALTVVIESTTRKHVASLVSISEKDIDDAFHAIASKDTELCINHGQNWGFEGICASIRQLGTNRERLLAISRMMTLFLDMAIISFSGAHLENIDQKYLRKVQQRFNVPCTPENSLILRRRSLKCLDGYINHRPVWVFRELHHPAISERLLMEDEGMGEDVDGRGGLYLSTTMDDFGRVWGPIWVTYNKTPDGDGSSRIGKPYHRKV